MLQLSDSPAPLAADPSLCNATATCDNSGGCGAALLLSSPSSAAPPSPCITAPLPNFAADIIAPSADDDSAAASVLPSSPSGPSSASAAVVESAASACSSTAPSPPPPLPSLPTPPSAASDSDSEVQVIERPEKPRLRTSKRRRDERESAARGDEKEAAAEAEEQQLIIVSSSEDDDDEDDEAEAEQAERGLLSSAPSASSSARPRRVAGPVSALSKKQQRRQPRQSQKLPRLSPRLRSEESRRSSDVRAHAVVCQNGRVFPLSLLDPQIAGVRHVVLLDLDNWPAFFLRLPQPLSDGVLVCAFMGGETTVKVPDDALAQLETAAAAATAAAGPSAAAASSSSSSRCLSPFSRLVSARRVMVVSCGRTANAADFALSVKVGQLHALLPLHVPFTLFSGDAGLDEVTRHVAGRRCARLDPHAQHVRGHNEQTDALLYHTLQSVTDA